MEKIRHTLLGLTVVLLAACSTTKHKAPVVDGSPAVRKAPALAQKADRPGYYTVRPGDTLSRIARRFGQSTDNLAAWNSLANKNDLRVGQELRIKLSNDASGVQTAAIAGGSAVEVRPLTSDSGKPAESHLQAATPVPTQSDALVATRQEEGISWMWPAEGKIVANFQEGKSKGIDIAGRLGQKVVAAADGKVLFASAIRGYGNLVIIKHNDNLVSAYAHNKAILVKEGAIVSKGQQIAEMGMSDSDIVKLHLEIRRQGRPVDPASYLPTR